MNEPADPIDTRAAAWLAVGEAQIAARGFTPTPADVRSRGWLTAPWQAQVADLALLGLAVLIHADAERSERTTALKEAAVAISGTLGWAIAARRPSHAELTRRRAGGSAAGG